MIRVFTRCMMIATAALAYVAGGACGDSQPRFGTEEVNVVESPGFPTDHMHAVFRARSTEAGETRVTSELRILSTGPIISYSIVDLDGGDQLIAAGVDPGTLEETERVLTAGAFGPPNTIYGARFGGGDKDQPFEIVFDRSATGQASAGPTSTTLPSPFELDWVEDPVAMTPAPRPFSRSSATSYYVVWDPFDAPDFEPGDELLFVVTGKCIAPYWGVLDWEGGEDTLELTGVLQGVSNANGGRCKVRVEITLRRTGIADVAYEGGSFYGEQVRVLELDSTR